MSDAIGVMEGAFFVPKSVILAWVNDLLKLNITTIEQTATGAVACQVMDILYPGVVPLHKINWKPIQEYEIIQNYKILQQVFIKQGIKQHFEINKLIKGKYQDNLEFMQWLKRFYEINVNRSRHYDPVAKRQECFSARKLTPRKYPTTRKTATPEPNIKEEEKILCKSVGPISVNQEMIYLKTERDFYKSKLNDLETLLHFHENEKTAFIEEMKKIIYGKNDDNRISESTLPSNSEAEGEKGRIMSSYFIQNPHADYFIKKE